MRPPPRRPARRPEEPPRPIADGLMQSEDHVDAIEQSHERCVALGVSPIERPDHTPLGRPDFAVVRERNLRLHDQAAPVMAMLYEQIVHSQSMVVLTDATGTIIHSVGDDDFLERASKVALRPGAVWSETAKGTNAIGTALVEETPTLVHADEHYVHANQFLTCSAAPILDPRGNILGVLDVSGDHRSYHQHTMALVKMSARMIENRWLADDHRDVLRLHFHGRVEFIGTLMEGILAVAADGRIVGANRGALEQLGLSGAALRQHTLGTLLGTSVSALVDRFRSPLATPTTAHLGDGRRFHLLARFNWPVWTSLAEAVAAAPAPAAPPAPRAAPTALDALRSGDARWGRVIDQLQRVRDRAIPVLLVGESGTGKDLLARALHDDSAHAGRPFVAVDCATLPDAAEAATLLARADGGTLYLDGLDELPPAHQAHLLAALREPPPGPAAAIVGAAHQPLRDAVDRGAFREDLFQRLSGLALRLPPLRERSDLAVLAQRLLAVHGSAAHQVAPELLTVLQRHRWPGNVRELSNLLRTACAMAGDATVLRIEHLGDDINATGTEAPSPATGAQKLDALELDAIRRAVDAAGGNITEAAKRLGVSRNTIYRRLRWNAPR